MNNLIKSIFASKMVCDEMSQTIFNIITPPFRRNSYGAVFKLFERLISNPFAIKISM